MVELEVVLIVEETGVEDELKEDELEVPCQSAQSLLEIELEVVTINEGTELVVEFQ